MSLISYTQPSESHHYDGESTESLYSETEELIRRDQAEIAYKYAMEQVQYPPQPEVEFGFPQTCYCGSKPFLATCYNRQNQGRRYYTCANVDDGDCHVHKWWDDAVMEEMRARDHHTLQLAEKVDALGLSTDSETEEKLARLEKLVSDLAKKKPRFNLGSEWNGSHVVMFVVFVFLLVGMVVMFK